MHWTTHYIIVYGVMARAGMKKRGGKMSWCLLGVAFPSRNDFSVLLPGSITNGGNRSGMAEGLYRLNPRILSPNLDLYLHLKVREA